MMNEETVDISPLMDQGGNIDVADLAKRIQQRVEQKISSGFYDEREIQGVKALAPDVSENGMDWFLYNKQKADPALDVLEDKWDITKPVDTSSPRGGAKGALVSIYKKIFNKIIRPNLNIALANQAEFNSEVAHFALHLKEAALRSEEEFRALRDRYLNLSDRCLKLEESLVEKDKKLASLEGRFATGLDPLVDRVEDMALSLRDVDKQGIFLKRRLVALLDSMGNIAGRPADDVVATESEKLKSFDYTLFENLHRGSREEIKSRLTVYTQWFESAAPVIDIGCGRGELIELFGEKGIDVKGVDLNSEMVAQCKDRGLVADHGDAIGYLHNLKDGSIGGVTAIQFIEHLPNDAMVQFFEVAFDKLKPGGTIAAETVNPTCLSTFCGAFYLDMSHDKPIHPLAVQFVLERIGYCNIRIEYLNPFPEDHMLKKLSTGYTGAMDPGDLEEYNRNVDKLNGILYSHQDYAIVAQK